MIDSKNEDCPICGNELKRLPEIEKKEFSLTVCFCAICGKFKTDISSFDSATRNMLASYLFCNIEKSTQRLSLLQPPHQKPFVITTKENRDKVEEECRNKNIIVTLDEVKKWYPQTDEERVNRILVGLSNRQKYNEGLVILNAEEAYSAFLVERYNVKNIDSIRLPNNKLQEQVKEIYTLLKKRGFIDKNISNFKMDKITGLRVDILLSGNGEEQVRLLKNEPSPSWK